MAQRPWYIRAAYHSARAGERYYRKVMAAPGVKLKFPTETAIKGATTALSFSSRKRKHEEMYLPKTPTKSTNKMQIDGAPKKKKARKPKRRYKAKTVIRKGRSIKPRKVRAPIHWNQKGSVEKFEINGSATSAECVYLGHSTLPPRKVLISICRCIVKELYRLHGRTISSWFDTVGQTPVSGEEFAISYSYFTRDTSNNLSPDEDPTSTARQITINSGTATFQSVAEALATDMHENLINREHHVFERFQLRRATTGVAVREVYSEFYASEFFLKIGNTSLMKFQNVTGARDEEADATDNNESDNIAKNPVHFRSYESYTQNGLTYRHKRNVAASVLPFNLVGNDSTGLIYYDPINHNATSLFKAPLGPAFGSTKSAAGNIQPGEMRTSYITKTSGFMNLSSCLNKFMDTFGNTYNYIVKMGACRVFAMEHQINISAGAFPDPPVKIEYQIDTTLRCMYKHNPKNLSEVIVDT